MTQSRHHGVGADVKTVKTSGKAEVPPEPDAKVEREHRRLQHLVKRIAEQSGYRAVIEQPTPDGQGRVDVGLERDDRRIACEISVTTTAEQELANILKCLGAGYDCVLFCSPEKKNLEKVRSLASSKLPDPDLEKVLFLEPEGLVLFFEEEAARQAGTEDRVKGYAGSISQQFSAPVHGSLARYPSQPPLPTGAAPSSSVSKPVKLCDSSPMIMNLSIPYPPDLLAGFDTTDTTRK